MYVLCTFKIKIERQKKLLWESLRLNPKPPVMFYLLCTSLLFNFNHIGMNIALKMLYLLFKLGFDFCYLVWLDSAKWDSLWTVNSFPFAQKNVIYPQNVFISNKRVLFLEVYENKKCKNLITLTSAAEKRILVPH